MQLTFLFILASCSISGSTLFPFGRRNDIGQIVGDLLKSYANSKKAGDQKQEKENKQSDSNTSCPEHCTKPSCPEPPKCTCGAKDGSGGGGGGGNIGGSGGGGGGGGEGGKISITTGGSGERQGGNKEYCLDLISLITKRHTKLERKLVSLIRFYQNEQPGCRRGSLRSLPTRWF
ncbi:hypothetical protein GE061_019723 [Apolygus lucorum]|uniref:Uncharacterized protein n=1 Tax=Apolygus lucorum TaxID=248454 RepID=A0A8S9X8W9_APOLU|nr:hypothetical protein GE061_019723 [Apolygus lucorum]